MSIFEDLQDRAGRLLGKTQMVDAAQNDAVGAAGTGIAQPTGGTGLLGWMSGNYAALLNIATQFTTGAALVAIRTLSPSDTVTSREGVGQEVMSFANQTYSVSTDFISADLSIYSVMDSEVLLSNIQGVVTVLYYRLAGDGVTYVPVMQSAPQVGAGAVSLAIPAQWGKGVEERVPTSDLTMYGGNFDYGCGAGIGTKAKIRLQLSSGTSFTAAVYAAAR